MSDAVSILATKLSGELATPSAWLVGTAYTAGQSVTRSGLSYYAISGSTGADPATDAGVHWGLLSGSGPQPADMVGLSSAIVAGAQATLASRQANRVALLGSALNGAALPANTNVGEVAQSFDEVQAAATFLASAQSLDTQLAVLRAFDTQGPLSAMIANIKTATLTAWANLLVTSAAAFETLEAEALLTA